MATWPTSLPQILLLDGYDEQPVDNVIRSPVDQGPEITRPKYSSTPIDFTGSLILTSAQCDALDSFYDATLNFGTAQFDWVNSRTGAAVSLKFRARPGYQGAGGGLYRTTLSLRQWP